MKNINCPNCQREISVEGIGSYVCPYCKATFSVDGEQANTTEAPHAHKSSLTCPKCESENVSVQSETHVKTERRGCISWMLWLTITLIMGLFMIIIGIVTFIFGLITNNKIRSSTKTVGICQNCGYKWTIR